MEQNQVEVWWLFLNEAAYLAQKRNEWMNASDSADEGAALQFFDYKAIMSAKCLWRKSGLFRAKVTSSKVTMEWVEFRLPGTRTRS